MNPILEWFLSSIAWRIYKKKLYSSISSSLGCTINEQNLQNNINLLDEGDNAMQVLRYCSNFLSATLFKPYLFRSNSYAAA